MRIGLIARADNTGLGTQCWEFYRAMKPAKTIVVDLSAQKGNKLYPDRYPDAEIVKDFPTAEDFTAFLDGLDALFTCEIPYGYELFRLADEAGVKTVLQYNFEFLDYLKRPHLPTPTLFAAPSPWRFEDVPYANKRLLPVPIATDRFNPTSKSGPAKHFLHIAGTPAVHDRNGTADLLKALRYVQSDITVTIKCQAPRYVPTLLQRHQIPQNVTLIVDHSEVVNYWDNYTGDVLILPRRFGGLCLPAQEALAAGMPVVMPSISPNEWLPADWLVPATLAGRFMTRTMIDLYTVDHRALAVKIEQLATDPAFYSAGDDQARSLAHELNRESQKPV
jgi:glycosyltransferase involved in cell wall biosynthesis